MLNKRVLSWHSQMGLNHMVKIINYEELTILILMNFRIKRDKIVIFFLKKN